MFFDFEQRSGVSFACICRQKALNVSGSARSNSLFAYYHPYSDSFPNIGSTSPCVRRQAMQAGKFLRRVTIFLFCCFHLPSIVWICFFFSFCLLLSYFFWTFEGDTILWDGGDFINIISYNISWFIPNKILFTYLPKGEVCIMIKKD